MQDRYLFRAKRLDNDEWETGNIRFAEGIETSIIVHGILAHQVHPKTVGQCTGLRDKYNNLIFEDDIVKWTTADLRNPKTLIGVVGWHGDCYKVDIGGENTWFLSVVVDRNCEIIGNRFSHPHLLTAHE